jgi:wyosine [tRNA(Phe)-imidazoG37] synthetase (radical SAM superfamily)
MSFLFDEIIFGPVKSRRLGVSLGINVLPRHKKWCSFNCIYCECGWTTAVTGDLNEFHSREDICKALEHHLKELVIKKAPLDAITFAGNGEPTLHPEFPGVIDDTIKLRDTYFPKADVVVLSNSTTLNNNGIFEALLKVRNIMKLDAGTEKMYNLINHPLVNVSLEEIVSGLIRFNGKLTIQTLFLKAMHNGQLIDNTTDEEVGSWINLLKRIKPQQIMIYPIDRPTPDSDIEKISPEVLEKIGARVKEAGFQVNIYS